MIVEIADIVVRTALDALAKDVEVQTLAAAIP